MKPLFITLATLLIVLQAKLWLSDGGISQIWQLRQAIAKQKEENKQLEKRNLRLAAEIKDLKHGREAIEERARADLGMTKKDEVFYQIVGQ